MKANYTVIIDRRSFILIRDNCEQYGTMSVTNDAEAVVANVLAYFGLFKEKILYYIDTDRRVDILCHDGLGNFTGFKFGYDNVEDFYKENG